MTNWDGNERRASLVNLERLLEDHIKQDDIKLVSIGENIHVIDKNISNLITLNTEALKNQMVITADIQKVINDHSKFLYDPKDGVSIQLDRLNGAEESRKWTFRVMWAAIISILTKIFYDLIKR